jgi:opacity protein-like surface antigen
MRMTSSLRAAIVVGAIAGCIASPAFADDLTGAYFGAGIGLGRVQAGTAGLAPTLGDFDQTHLAYHLDFGIHPANTPLALELEYLDLGQPNLPSTSTLSGSVSQRGGGLFLLYYLPIPIVQAYIKGGGSRITTHADFAYCSPAGAGGTSPTCVLPSSNPTNNAFAFGAGVQWTLNDRWAVRGEYERFNAGGGNPSLLTVGVDWTFL